MAQVEGDVELEILYVHPGNSAAALRRRERSHGIKKGWFGNEDNVRPAEHFADQSGKAGQGEAGGVQRARDSARLRRNPDRAAHDMNAVEDFRLVAPGFI